MTALESTVKEQRDVLKELRAEKQSLQKANSSSQKSLSTLNGTIEKQKLQIKKLAEAKSTADAKLKKLSKETAKSKSQQTSLSSSIAKSKASARAAREKLATVKADLQAKIKEKNGVIRELKKAKPKTAKAKSVKTKTRKPKGTGKAKSLTTKSKSRVSVTAKSKSKAKPKSTKRKSATAKTTRRKTVDNLKKVEGVGPKIEKLLQKDGINTFKKLSRASQKKLNGILDSAGPRFSMHDPTTWPEQAGLAADGKWDRLEKLQDRLDGGRGKSKKTKSAKARFKKTTAKKATKKKTRSAKASVKSKSKRQTKASTKRNSRSNGSVSRVASSMVAKKDDLTKVEGIGPAIEKLLNNAGVHSFNDLAKSNAAALNKILDAAGPRFNIHDPKSWPKQSGLAAKGKWGELEALQDELMGGRTGGFAGESDDLTRIEGIGPKIQELLNDAGLNSFSDVAVATAKKINAILDAAGPRFNIHDPTSWPKQAEFAANGRWDELDLLQEKLMGGR
jgi:predicted flap endonuclease-1-like 5' DNA nuclease